MQRIPQNSRRLLPRFLLAVMLCAACGLTVSSTFAEGDDNSDDMDIINQARAARLLDHGSGGGIRLLVPYRSSRQSKDVKIPVIHSSLRIDLILPFKQIEVAPKKPKQDFVKRPNRWRSDAFKKWKKRRGK